MQKTQEKPIPVFQAAPRADWPLRALVLAVYAASVLLPLSWLDHAGLVVCPFRQFTGLPCPGCGLTHAFICLGHGHLAAAWHYNALAFPLYALGLFWLARQLRAGKAASRPLLSASAIRRAWLLAVLVTLAFFLYRLAIPSARPF